jgi:phage shock protein PspC (stress-responsive transcriptional regulator)
MAKFATHACHACGIRLPQPEMVRKQVSYEAGSSQTGLSKRTIVGAILGGEESEKSLGKWLWNPSKRVYKRKRTVWLCGDCAGSGSKSRLSDLVVQIIFILAVVSLAVDWLLKQIQS